MSKDFNLLFESVSCSPDKTTLLLVCKANWSATLQGRKINVTATVPITRDRMHHWIRREIPPEFGAKTDLESYFKNSSVVLEGIELRPIGVK